MTHTQRKKLWRLIEEFGRLRYCEGMCDPEDSDDAVLLRRCEKTRATAERRLFNYVLRLERS